MSLMKKIATDQLQARKDKDPVAKPLLTTLKGDAEAIGKNDGGRETTDLEIIDLVKSFLKKNKETIQHITDRGGDTSVFEAERVILSEFLPKQMSDDELLSVITIFITEEIDDPSMKAMGKVMGHLKQNYLNLYDNTLASKIIRDQLS